MNTYSIVKEGILIRIDPFYPICGQGVFIACTMKVLKSNMSKKTTAITMTRTEINDCYKEERN